MSSANSNVKVLTPESWDVKAIKYYPPKQSNGGGKNVKFVSSQTGKTLNLNLPKMTQYGISDYMNKDTGVHDGKFKMSLKVSDPKLVEKLLAFKEQLIDDAVKNSQLWFGGQKPILREIAEYNLKFALTYPSASATDKTPDTSKAPYFKISVPYYKDSGWDIQVFDQNKQRLFPDESGETTPVDLVPSGAEVCTFIQCNTIWIVDGKWGPTFKLVQCLVYPKDDDNYRNKCVFGESDAPAPYSKSAVTSKVIHTTVDEDDDDQEEPAAPAPVVKAPEPEPEPVVEEPVKKTVVKKTIKKAVAAN